MSLDPDFATEHQTFSDWKFNLNGNAKVFDCYVPGNVLTET